MMRSSLSKRQRLYQVDVDDARDCCLLSGRWRLEYRAKRPSAVALIRDVDRSASRHDGPQRAAGQLLRPVHTSREGNIPSRSE